MRMAVDAAAQHQLVGFGGHQWSPKGRMPCHMRLSSASRSIIALLRDMHSIPLKGRRMRRADILVINPNSNPAVTAGLDAALGILRRADGPSIRCTTLAEGPFGIESQQDVEQVTLPLRRLVEQDNAADAFVIACFSDPGLQLCREATRRPVFGINECGVLTALSRGDRFGIIAIAAKSVARHRRYLRQMGLAGE